MRAVHLILDAIMAVLLLACVFTLGMAWPTPAWPHSFFSPACCGSGDCAGPVEPGEVRWTPEGWAVSMTQEVVPFNDKRIQYNPPGEPGIFICKVPSVPTVRCLYLPEPQG